MAKVVHLPGDETETRQNELFSNGEKQDAIRMYVSRMLHLSVDGELVRINGINKNTNRWRGSLGSQLNIKSINLLTTKA